MLPQKITVAEIKAACRKFYEEGRLLAQNPDLPYGYQRDSEDHKDCRCAIGTVLSFEALEKIEAEDLQKASLTNTRHGSRLRKIITWDRKEYEELAKIQKAHDNWMMFHQDRDAEDIKEKRFLELIKE